MNVEYEEKINIIVENLFKKLKTEELIKLMAKEKTDWSQGSIDRAIRECNTCVFSLDDIAFQRALLSSEEYQEKQRKIHEQLDSMVLYRGEERKRYFNQEISPIIQERDGLYNKIKERFKDLKLYT